jgi:hypothetical protein
MPKLDRLTYRPTRMFRHDHRFETDQGDSGPQREAFEWALIGTRVR